LPSSYYSIAYAVRKNATLGTGSSLINYQGRLTDQTGAPLVEGFYGIQFKLWDSPSPTTAKLIWAQQQTVAIQSNGVFNVILGSPGGSSVPGVTPAVNDLIYAFTANNRFLGLTVVSNTSGLVAIPSEILPRQQLLSVPFAVQAQVASSLVTNLENALCPAGSIIALGGTSIPAGWLLCDGTALSSGQYPGLYAAIGMNWGSGDISTGGTNNFNLPDLRGLFLRGVNGTRTNFTQVSTNLVDPDVLLRTSGLAGGNSGNAVGSIQLDVFGSHTHNSQYRHYSGAQNGGWIPPCGWGGGGPYDVIDQFYPTTSSGGNETRPKNAYVNYIIKY